jgi:hypothetical protein
MILYRPTWRANGERRTGRIWWMEATVAGHRHRRSLGVRDKHAAQALAAEIVRRLELQAAGIGVSEERTALTPPALVLEYEAELIRRRSSPQHIARTVQRLQTLFAKPRALSDITPAMLRKALARVASTGVSPQTVNAYRVAAHAFFAWLIREGRASTNPRPRSRACGPARARDGAGHSRRTSWRASCTPHPPIAACATSWPPRRACGARSWPP